MAITLSAVLTTHRPESRNWACAMGRSGSHWVLGMLGMSSLRLLNRCWWNSMRCRWKQNS